ncbi:T9SS type A sorting domain-containing protein [Chryseobacterium antibioticum]|uniref:T9SS type A sorting domain-containing protein n=1 Tax=Chryseobacterium pyrolae TaxID=2987481 RepID=A0ABT2IGW7_9FLAO|nr:T9SS type A sorting domain-containing protein [Chryseobacterium pyrolae]MCT2407844.1 T9SS type A sorting domain-containing protein [Chryseobacterium pyrolae]
MKKKSTLKIFAAVFCIASSHAYSGTFIVPKPNETNIGSNHKTPLPPSVYDLDPLIVISQNVNEKGLVVMKGNFQKPNTSGDVKVTIKYKDAQNNWVSVWCKTYAGNYEYNEDLTANFELPESTLNTHSVKIELSSDSSITNWQSITWNKTVNHYKKANYTYGNCDLDENQYTILFTPKKDGTVLYNSNGSVSGVKDRVKSQHLTKKLDDIVLSFQGNASLDNSNANSPIINITNPNSLSTIASSQKFIYQGSDTSPFEFSYHDPVYMFAGKFSNESFFINFSNWFLPPEEGGEPWGRGYLDFTNPNALVNRYYNLYNYINEKLGDVFANQQPVVIVISKVTGLRVYKGNGQYVSLTATSNYNTTDDFGYPPLYDKHRGPGSENFSLSNTSQASLYGVGAIRNTKVINSWNGPSRPLIDIESEINKFIKYVGLFGNPVTEDCPVACFTINSGAQSDFVDWTKAPNSYIFTGKDKNNASVDGLYIPVKKAYEMWAKGGEFMKDEQGTYTPIPTGTATTGLYWEDEMGLIKSVMLEGTGENAKIKVLVNKLKEGNAIVSYKVNDKIYWTWHVWVTDDPTDGSTYHQGFEKDKDGNLVTDWKWMDRNLGATNAKLTGNDWDKTKGLQYQWGRKDPFPVFKVEGEAGKFSPGIAQQNPLPVKFRGNLQPNDASGNNNNTGFDSPNGNIRYSINNPINYIVPPVYIYKIGETPVENGENYAVQGPNPTDWVRKENTTWFSKSKFKTFDSSNYYNNVAWDLWGDIREGRWTSTNTDNSDVLEKSTYYNMKSPYDPCPCGWRVPSFYSSVAGDANASPWGKKFRNTTTNIIPDAQSTDYPGIKVFPSYGFDFNGVSERNLGVIPINGNYEYYPQPMTLKDGSGINRNSSKIFLGMGSANKGPEAVLQDQITDGALHSSTFFTHGAPSEIGARGLVYVSDAGNVPNHSNLGWHFLAHNRIIDGNTYESRGVRCIKDPNNSYMPSAFEAEYVYSPASQYTLEQLRSWAKEPNSYIEYTNSTLNTTNAADKDRVIDIPLRKAYAMQKLYLSENNEMPTGSVKSTSVVWTTDQTLISSVEIIDDGILENAKLRVILKEGKTGNAVVAFHLGSNGTWSNGNNTDPILWSWHIWAPQTIVQEYSPAFKTESVANNGIKSDPSGQFVNPVKSYYGVPLTTTFMDRDLGAQGPFLDQHFVAEGLANFQYNPNYPASESSLRAMAIRNSGGLHYQWGRKDPIPVFYYPGGFYEHSSGGSTRDNFRKYSVFRQTGLNAGTIVYGTVNEATYLANYSKEYSTYSNSITAADSKYNKIKKILKYSVSNPSTYLYQNASSNSKDWISDENGLSTDRWGHATEKSPYDPCPQGWRIPDMMMNIIDGVNLYDGYHSYTKGNTPWFYNARFMQSNKPVYGIDPSNYNIFVNNEAYDINKMNYIGGYVRATGSGRTQTRYGFILNRPEYNIGNFPNNGIRGFTGGNTLTASQAAAAPGVDDNFKRSGIWTSAIASDQAIGMLFNTEITQSSPLQNDKLYFLTPTNLFRPQAAMSCRCVKIEYDGNGNEIGRYEPFAIPVPQNALAKATNILAKTVIEEKVAQNKLEFFPNPVKSLLYIKGNDKAKDYYYQIYNISGQLVKSGKFENEQTDLSSLLSGVYLVRINNSETIVKIIKQ